MRPSSVIDEPQAGDILDGRFRIVEKLGAGAFGAVYRAEQLVFDLKLRTIALKLFRSNLITPENAHDVLNDAVMLFQLQEDPAHARVACHLVTAYDAGFLHGPRQTPFLTMEYIEGYPVPGGHIRTLAGLIRAFHPVAVELALRWMVQILRPLAWMHTLAPHPVLHGDLKPNNVLICGKDTLKVADFGLAQLAFGLICSAAGGGAVIYQPPETLAGVLPTPASDVYSLGLLFLEILVGHNPFEAVGLEAQANGRRREYTVEQVRAREELDLQIREKNPYKLLTTDPYYLLSQRLHDDPLLLDIIDRCLRFKAADRFDNSSGVLKAVEGYIDGHGLVVPACTRELNDPVAREPPPPNLERMLAEVESLLHRNRLDDAQKRCDQARRSFPKSGKPFRWQAEILLAKSELQEALKVCSQGRRIAREEPELLSVCADIYDRLAEKEGDPSQRETARRLRVEADALRHRQRDAGPDRSHR
jgi:serine/threonine protein kinase